jgi:hypothetical protein
VADAVPDVEELGEVVADAVPDDVALEEVVAVADALALEEVVGVDALVFEALDVDREEKDDVADPVADPVAVALLVAVAVGVGAGQDSWLMRPERSRLPGSLLPEESESRTSALYMTLAQSVASRPAVETNMRPICTTAPKSKSKRSLCV